jgi:ubiquinone/menaquinone biosynthesis C-methylase UbiE
MFNAEWNDRAWEHLMQSVKTGETAFELAHGMPVAQWLEHNNDTLDVFNRANAVKAAAWNRTIIEAYDFSGLKTLTDVGGGPGILISEILVQFPEMNGIVADIPFVIEMAEETIQEKGLEDRCQTVVCNFFNEIPEGSDAYLLSNILHDWPDEQCRKILNNVRRAMNPESRLLVVEMVIPPGNEPSVAKLLDLEMLVITGGRERTEAEFNDLFKSSGFRISRIVPTDESVSIIEVILE